VGAPLRLVVFDWDGTLVDSQRAIVAAMRATFARHHLPPPAAAAVRRLIGLSLTEAIAALTPELGAEAHRRLTETYREDYRTALRSEDPGETVVTGIPEVLDALESAGFLLGVATGKSRRGLEASLERHGLAGRFATLQGSDAGPGKPSPDMLLRGMAEVGAATRHTCMVGDTVFDVAMALAARVTPVGVAWGYHDPEELLRAGAAAVAERPADLLALAARTTAPDPREAGT
jgi:phosphoglycolate phosphatase